MSLNVLTSTDIELFKPAPRTILETEFAIGDKVKIDDSDLTGFITGFWWKGDNGFYIQVGWLSNSGSQSDWFDKFRIKPIK